MEQEIKQPKFAVGDKVTLNGKAGEVTEVGECDAHWLARHEQMYSVRTDEFIPHMVTHGPNGPLAVPGPAVGDDGKPLGDFRVVGCVAESKLKKGK